MMADQLPLLTWEKHAEHYRVQKERPVAGPYRQAPKPKALRRIELEIQVREGALRSGGEVKNDLAAMRLVAVFEQIDALPCTEHEATSIDRNADRDGR